MLLGVEFPGRKFIEIMGDQWVWETVKGSIDKPAVRLPTTPALAIYEWQRCSQKERRILFPVPDFKERWEKKANYKLNNSRVITQNGGNSLSPELLLQDALG